MLTVTIQFSDITELQNFIAATKHDAPEDVVAQIEHGAAQAITETPVAAPKPRGRPKKSETLAALTGDAPETNAGKATVDGEAKATPVSQTTTEAPLDEARAALQTLVTTKGMESGFEVLKQFGAQRVSEVKAEDYSLFVDACKGAV
jgi:hypothetical protein